jgi:hypothetical protein
MSGRQVETSVGEGDQAERPPVGRPTQARQPKDNFLLEGTVDANVETIDDFHVKITANSPNLKIDKYVIEAQSKPAKTGRRIR